MKVGDITEFGEVSLVDYEKCFVRFCDVGSPDRLTGCFSMTYKEIEDSRSAAREYARRMSRETKITN